MTNAVRRKIDSQSLDIVFEEGFKKGKEHAKKEMNKEIKRIERDLVKFNEDILARIRFMQEIEKEKAEKAKTKTAAQIIMLHLEKHSASTAELIIALKENHPTIEEGAIRTALHRLCKREKILNRDNKWCLIK